MSMTLTSGSRRALPAPLTAAFALARSGRLIVLIALGALAAALFSGCAREATVSGGPPLSTASWLLEWNQTAIDASGLDHTPVAPGERRTFGENLGPGRASRAMAIVHIAMFEAVNAIEGGYTSYVGMSPAPAGASVKAAIAQAAYETLDEMYPSQGAAFAALLEKYLQAVTDARSRSLGVQVGHEAALGILRKRDRDGADHSEPVVGVDHILDPAPGKWRPDPVSGLTVALGARWAEVDPFVMESATQFRLPPPPGLGSPEYTLAFEEVKRLGGDGDVTATERSLMQTIVGVYWAYDGMPSLCAPPRLYNQITRTIAAQQGTSELIELARLLALVNVAMADAGIASWESKYFFNVARPVTAIREAAGDGNAATAADATFTPLGAPKSNTAGPNFTPPFPAYPSGHATFGGALFQILRRFYGKDDIAFSFTSDEFDGTTEDIDGNPRPRIPRHFTSLSEAEEENGQSRIYLGIHWSFDKTGGILQGRQVANWCFERIFTRAHQ